LAWQLVVANGSTPSIQTCFPVVDSAAKYESLNVPKVKGMSQDAIDAITATKPYQGGNDALWILHKLDIADKHHALLTAIVSVSAMRLEIGTFNNFKAPGCSLPNFQTPLKDGDVFFTCEPGLENSAYFTFDVAFSDLEIIEGKPIVPTLLQIMQRVDHLITTFEPLLA
jgi:hypothetical protein